MLRRAEHPLGGERVRRLLPPLLPRRTLKRRRRLKTTMMMTAKEVASWETVAQALATMPTGMPKCTARAVDPVTAR